MYCKYCGHPLDQDSNYCSACGQRIKYPDNDRKDTLVSELVHENNFSAETGDKVQTKKQPWYKSKTVYVLYLIMIGLMFAGNITVMLIGSNPIKPIQGFGLSFWSGVTAAIIAKKNGKPGWRWFIIGFIPIGFSVFFLLCVFRAIISHH